MKMIFVKTRIVLIVMLLLVGKTDAGKEKACKVTMWQPTSAVQRLSISPVVVLGTIYGYIAHNDSSTESFHALYRVHCVLRNDNIEVKSEIVIENIYPRTGCSGTKEKVLKDEISIVGLRRLESGNFEWHEKNPLETISFNATYDFVTNVSQTCGLQNWTVPFGSNDVECQVCSNDLGIVGSNDKCMLGNLKNETCAEIPEFKIYSHCSCDHAAKAGIVFADGSTLRPDFLFVLTVFGLSCIYSIL
jgi:hypothetical protein